MYTYMNQCNSYNNNDNNTWLCCASDVPHVVRQKSHARNLRT